MKAAIEGSKELEVAVQWVSGLNMRGDSWTHEHKARVKGNLLTGHRTRADWLWRGALRKQWGRYSRAQGYVSTQTLGRKDRSQCSVTAWSRSLFLHHLRMCTHITPNAWRKPSILPLELQEVYESEFVQSLLEDLFPVQPTSLRRKDTDFAYVWICLNLLLDISPF